MIALLLNHLWQSSLCVGGAGLIALALSRNGANVRFWLWFAASIKFLVPFAVLTALSAYFLAPVVPPMAVPTVRLIEPLVEPLARPFSAPAIAPVTVGLATEPSIQPVPLARPAPPARSRSALPALSRYQLDLESALLALWAAGFLMLAIRWLTRWSRVRALLREAVHVQIDAPVAVKFSPSRLEPGLVGILHPIILLPQGIEQQLTPEELQAVLAHELCHWRRRDNLLAAIHMLVEALFWFFPLVWWVGARLNAERERACDESVLADGNNPRTYAEGILKVCRAYLQSPLTCVAGVSGGGLKKRIITITENRLILQLNAARKFVLSVSAAAALALPLALGLLAAPVAQMQAKAAQILSPIKTAQRSTEQAPESSTATLPTNQVAENPPMGQALQTNEAASANAALPSPDVSRLPRERLVVPSPDLSQLPQTTPGLVASNDPPGAPDAAQAVAANASECAPPKLVNSLPMEQAPGSDVMTVTAAIDGNPERLLIGIGDLSTQLWNTPATKLDLPLRGRSHPVMDAGGRFSQDAARVGEFKLGSMETGTFDIQIMPDPGFANAGTDGILGTDMMQRYDIDLDFAHRQLNYFTPEQCNGAGVYWSPGTVTPVDMVTYSGVLYVPVTLDGHTIIALLDTSANRTFLNPQVAERLFGLKADSLEAGNVTDGGALIKAGMHTFSSLSFGGLTFNSPQIAVPFDVATEDTKEFHASRVIRDRYHLSDYLPPMIIGMDVLKQSHLYISFQDKRVYVSAAGDGQALKQPTPTSISWFNVWRYGYDAYLPYIHKFFGL
jgi:beta-lactamase regulating signal transducer with metallopeptidase domain